MTYCQSIGRAGERLVDGLLCAAGWTILAANFRHIGTELDLLASKEHTLIVVEVKTRAHWPPGSKHQGLLAPRKVRAIRAGVERFLATQLIQPHTIRLDLALVSARPRIYLAQYFVDAAQLDY